MFRPLQAGEMDQAARIHRAAMMTVPCFDETLHTPEEDRAFYRDTVFADCEILGAFKDDKLLGHAAHSSGWINHFYVDPAVQGCGVGSQLLDQVKVKSDQLDLWTFQANEGARHFYERHGFVAQEFTDGSTNEEREPDVRYRWKRRLK